MHIIALIPARGGSKGVPGKNIARILEKPLIAYTIEAALGSSLLQSVIVSSDSEDILSVARKFNSVRIHQRNPALAQDSSPISQTISEILSLYPLADAFMLLQPTSPIRESWQIDEAIALFQENKEANSLISVCAMNDVHPARMYWTEENGLLKSILPEFEHTRRQEIPTAWYRNGSIYIVRREAFERSGEVMCKPSMAYEMPAAQLLNIDEPRDLLIAEPLIRAWKEGNL